MTRIVLPKTDYLLIASHRFSYYAFYFLLCSVHSIFTVVYSISLYCSVRGLSFLNVHTSFVFPYLQTTEPIALGCWQNWSERWRESKVGRSDPAVAGADRREMMPHRPHTSKAEHLIKEDGDISLDRRLFVCDGLWEIHGGRIDKRWWIEMYN